MGNPITSDQVDIDALLVSVADLTTPSLKLYFQTLFLTMSQNSKTAVMEILWSRLSPEEQREIRLPFERTRLSESWIDQALTSAWTPLPQSPQGRILSVADLLEFAFTRLSAVGAIGMSRHVGTSPAEGRISIRSDGTSPARDTHGGHSIFTILNQSYRRADFGDGGVVITSLEPEVEGEGELDFDGNAQ